MANCRLFFAVFAIFFCFLGDCIAAPYYGKLIGKLSELHHGVSGEVYAVDGRTLYIKDFTYDGQGPAAYFYASVNKAADKRGFRLRDENGSGEVIRRYRKEGVTLTLPDGKNLNSIKIFYLWCEEFDVNFGDVKIPRGFDYPKPLKIDALKGVHSVSSDNIVIVDAQTLLIPNLSYDGEAPDAKFWVGKGAKPSPQGIRVPDENGKEAPLRRYDRKTIVLTLPGDLTVFDIGHFGIWCEAFTVDFGHIQIPQFLNIPPSLKMLGVSPQSKLNCEVLHDELAFEVRWAVAGESIVLQLVAKLGAREYMSFGLSGDDSQSIMIGGDVVVAWVDKETLKGYAEDYYLQDKAQCSGPKGSCPDNRLQANTNNVRLLNAATVNGYSIVTYQRSLKASDQYDLPVYTNKSQAIIWAVGPLNQREEVSFHTSYLKKDKSIDFGRPAKWNCPMPESEQPPMVAVQGRGKFAEEEPPKVNRVNEKRRGGTRGSVRQQQGVEFEDSVEDASRTKEQPLEGRKRGPQRVSNNVRTVVTPKPVKKRDAWDIPPIQCYEPEDGVYYAQMGPTGGKRGYSAITGHVGWGISWYINGLLIPEINVVRGKTYTFVVEGGLDPEVSAKYHPFYITDDSIGGYEYKTAEERKAVNIYAGVQKAKDGSLVPIGVGRLCHWTQTGDHEADDFESFGAYQRTLELKCDQGEPGVIQWTPDRSTPDTVYYQCFTHRYLGWKINVHDSCDEQPAASELKPVVVPVPESFEDKSDSDLEESPSIQVETRVKPNDIFIDGNEDKVSKSKVSEKEIASSPVVPEGSQSQPQQEKFFDSFFQYREPQVTTINFQFDKIAQQKPNHFYFRPSAIMHSIQESTSLPSTITSTISPSTSTSTSTTEAHIPTTQNTQKLMDNIAISSIASNESYLVPPALNLHTSFNENYYIRTPMRPQMYHKRHIPPGLKMVMRHPNLPPLRQKVPFKKSVIGRPMMKLSRPYPMDHEKPIYLTSPTQIRSKIVPPFTVAQTVPAITRLPPIRTHIVNNTKPLEVKNVEVSPLQASTEREPEIQTAPTNFREVTPTFIRPALNTGFKPSSIKIETGFKPIITKEFQDRIDQDDAVEIKYESETGMIDKDTERKFEHKPLHLFEPMFVPSPTDKTIKEKRIKIHKRPITKKHHQYTKIIVKQPRSINDTDELVAEAAERAETYYLPPLGQKPINIIREPSNIDIEAPPDTDLNIDSPPDVVVTYDGKKLSGQSLTAKLSDRPVFLEQRLSKATAYIKARPQFGKFKGELPPLDPELLFSNVAQDNSAVLNRNLDTPPIGDSLKLSRIGGGRKRREAHHTPEHTAEQEEEKNRQQNGSKRVLGNLSIVVGTYLLTYLYV